MGIFSNKKCIGWDIGSSGIRAVELENKNGRAHLKNYAYLDFDNVVDLSLNDHKTIKVIVEAIKKIVRVARFSTIDSYAVVPGYFSFNKIFNFTRDYSQEKIDRWLYSAISQNIYDNKRILLDWQLLSEQSNEKTVYASAVAESLIDKYQQIFKLADLKLIGIETAYHALIRSSFGTDNSNAVLIDVGSQFSDLTVIKNNIPNVSKSLKYGGHDITQDLSKNLNISYQQADQIKKDAVIVDKKLVAKIKKEINFLLKYYFANNENIKPDKIIITGGELCNAGNCQLFKKHFGIDTYLANPWSRISYNQDLKKHLNELSPKFSVAVGSAMKFL